MADRLFGRKEREENFKSTDGRGQNSLNFRCGSSSFSDETTLSSTTHAFYHTTSTRSPARRTRRLFLLFRPRLLILSIHINQKRRASNPKKTKHINARRWSVGRCGAICIYICICILWWRTESERLDCPPKSTLKQTEFFFLYRNTSADDLTGPLLPRCHPFILPI